jgi:DNA-binding response OmpR family regulator
MSAKHTLLLAAEPALAETLAEQFAALENFALCDDDAPWPDVILVDDRGCDAKSEVAQLRQRGFAGAAIVVSAGGASCPGADAMVKRPFRFAALLAAIEAALARRAALEFAPAIGANVRLTEKEAAILARLQRANGAAVSKADLLSEVWGFRPKVSTRTLETHIHRLRRKIEADPARPRRIVTSPGGYRLASAQSETALLPAP